MPAVFSLGIAPALSALQHELREGEHAVAHLDDICLLCQPDRVVPLYQRLEDLLWEHARLSLNAAKTRVWNEAGIAPPGIQALAPDSTIWAGDQRSNPKLSRVSSSWECRSGLQPMLTTICPTSLTAMALFCKLSLAWGILNRLGCFSSTVRRPGRSMPSACCPPRPQQGLLPPMTEPLVRVWRTCCTPTCMMSCLHSPWRACNLLSGRRGRAPCRPLQPAHQDSQTVCCSSSKARAPLRQPWTLRKLPVPAWRAILNSEPGNAQDDEPALDLLCGWQRLASRAVDDFLDRAHGRELSPGNAALLDSQCGPFAARVLTVRPTSPELTLPASLFRTLLLRRLRLPLPLSPAFCCCRQRLDVYGDHAAACPRSGLLRARGMPLERAAARVCREAGATVTLNTFVRDLNVDATRTDDRRIEVIANGMPLWGGAQSAVDTTLVSALTAAGAPRRHAGTAALRVDRQAKERTYPELRQSRRCRLVVLGIECAGRWSAEAASFIRLLARCRARAAAGRALLQGARCLRAAARAFLSSLLGLPLSVTEW